MMTTSADRTTRAGPAILVVGDPVYGFKFYGPFDNRDGAIAAADAAEDDWWIADLLAWRS
jgi:hypothetical protein